MPKYTSRQQLLSTKTVAEIAKQVHHEETPKLIKRQYLFSTYDARANLWREQTPNSEIIDWGDLVANQKIVCISKLRVVDQATAPNVPVANDPETMRNEALQAAADGVNVVAPQFQLQQGRRTNNAVDVYALSALCRLRVVRVNPSIYTDKVTFKMGFYLWTKIDAAGYLDNNDTPDVKTLVKWKPFGYSAQLDNITAGINYEGIPYATENLNMIMNSEKCKTLLEREITVNISSIESSVNMRVIRMYKEFEPINIQYDPGTLNQEGDRHLNHKIFFAIRSNLPNREIINIEPRAQICTKMYYKNCD